jgi:hypothetical protein
MAGSRLDALFEIAKDIGSIFKKAESSARPKAEPTFGGSHENGAESRSTAPEAPAFVPPEATRSAVNDILSASDAAPSRSVGDFLRDKSGAVKITKAEKKEEEKIARSIDQYTRRQVALGRDKDKVAAEAALLERNMRGPSAGSSGITRGQAALGGGVAFAILAALGQKTLSHGNFLGGLWYDVWNPGQLYNAQQQTIAAQTAHLVPDIPAQTQMKEPESWGKWVADFFGLSGTPQKPSPGSEQVPAAAPARQVPSSAPKPPSENTTIQQQHLDPSSMGCDPLFGCPAPSSKQHSELVNGSLRLTASSGRTSAPPIRTVLAAQSTIADQREIVASEAKLTKSTGYATQQRMTI